MEQNKKWYAEKYCKEYWIISATDPKDENLCTTNVLDTFDVGEQQAEQNAKLCAAAPDMRQLLEDMAIWVESYMNTSGQHDRNGARYALEQYRELEKQLQ